MRLRSMLAGEGGSKGRTCGDTAWGKVWQQRAEIKTEMD